MNSIGGTRSKTTAMLKNVLGKALGTSDLPDNIGLVDMGADSLSTVRLASLIK